MLVGEARAASLSGLEADVAVRLSRPTAGALKIVKVGSMPFRLYASPAYLSSTREPEWTFIAYEAAELRSPQQLALERLAGARPFLFRGGSLEIQQAAARAGAGIAALPDFMAGTDSALEVVPPGDVLLARDIWLVVHTDLRNAVPVRAVVEELKSVFRRMHGVEHQPPDRPL
jgi:DNA-binding transcriptional LysR family regulator